MNLSSNVERLELERQTANESYAAATRHYSKPVPPRLTLLELDPGYQLPAPTIAAMVRLCGENRRKAKEKEKDRDTALPAERERPDPFGLFKR